MDGLVTNSLASFRILSAPWSRRLLYHGNNFVSKKVRVVWVRKARPTPRTHLGLPVGVDVIKVFY
jgi:hypothetical protein